MINTFHHIGDKIKNFWHWDIITVCCKLEVFRNISTGEQLVAVR